MHQQMRVEEGWQTALAATAQRGLHPSAAYTRHSRHCQLRLPVCVGSPLKGRLAGASDYWSHHMKSPVLGLVHLYLMLYLMLNVHLVGATQQILVLWVGN